LYWDEQGEARAKVFLFQTVHKFASYKVHSGTGVHEEHNAFLNEPFLRKFK
jgi:hypothetical protein